MADGAGGPTVLRILLGTQLRRLREARGITAQEAARAIRGSASKISRIELGRNAVREVDIADLLSLYGITDTAEREQLLLLAGQANQPGWWHRYQDILPGWFQAYIGLEESAESIRSYDAQFIPGLLQTEEYARAVLQAANPDSSADEISRQVGARMDRQSILTHDEPPLLWVIIDECVLARPVGGTRVMREQVDHLIEAARLPRIMLQVVPADAGAHPGLAGQFAIAGFDGSPDVAYLDSALAGQIVERAGDVSRVALLYDLLKAEALAPRSSMDLVRKAIGRWT